MRSILCLALVAIPWAALAAEVKAPQNAPPYTLIRCESSTAGDGYAWFVDGPGSDDLADVLLDGKRLTFTGPPGRYKVRLVVLVGGKLDQGQAIVTIGAPQPSPGPAPTPTPGPGPTPNPSPPAPPLPLAGMRVLVICESDTPLPKALQDAVQSPAVAEYLRVKCLKGPDGKTPEKRIFDDDPPLTSMSAAWQALRAALPAQVPLDSQGVPIPHVAIGDSSGVVVHSGPYPPTEAEALALFTKYGGQ